MRREQLFPLLGLGALTLLSWIYIARLAAGMGEAGAAIALPSARAWSPVDFALLSVMWIVMMIAMMVPSATPMILTFAGVQRRRQAQERPTVPTIVFVLGYLLVWSGFSVAAAGLQWGLHRASLLSPMMVSASPVLGGSLLIAGGAYQFSSLKHACLATCRSPFAFLTTHWREGTAGALRTGIEHGAYCLGCCWLLMALLFVAGVMNLLWVATLAAVVFVEKAAPAGRIMARLVGAGLMVWGGTLLAGVVVW